MKRGATSRPVGKITPTAPDGATAAAEVALVRLLARQAAAEHVAALRTTRGEA